MKAILASHEELSNRTSSLASIQALMSGSLLTQHQSMSPGRTASYNKHNNPRRLSAVFEVSKTRKPRLPVCCWPGSSAQPAAYSAAGLIDWLVKAKGLSQVNCQRPVQCCSAPQLSERIRKNRVAELPAASLTAISCSMFVSLGLPTQDCTAALQHKLGASGLLPPE